MTNVTVYDCIHDNIPRTPAAGVHAGYTTGSKDIQWTADDWTAHPYAVRICQDAGATDTTADVLDIENGAATNAEAAAWYQAALTSYQNVTRPGQRYPALYTSADNVTPLCNALIAAGVTSGPRLWVAHWGIGVTAADQLLAQSSGPFPIIGVQYQSLQFYDVSHFLDDWLSTRSKKPPRTIVVSWSPLWPTTMAYAARKHGTTPETMVKAYQANTDGYRYGPRMQKIVDNKQWTKHIPLLSPAPHRVRLFNFNTVG